MQQPNSLLLCVIVEVFELIAAESAKNMMSAKNLAIAIGPTLFPGMGQNMYGGAIAGLIAKRKVVWPAGCLSRSHAILFPNVTVAQTEIEEPEQDLYEAYDAEPPARPAAAKPTAATAAAAATVSATTEALPAPTVVATPSSPPGVVDGTHREPPLTTGQVNTIGAAPKVPTTPAAEADDFYGPAIPSDVPTPGTVDVVAAIEESNPFGDDSDGDGADDDSATTPASAADVAAANPFGADEGGDTADQMPIYGNADLEVEANNPFGDADGDGNAGELYGTVDERVQVAAVVEALAGSTSGPTPADLVASANPFGDDDDDDGKGSEDKGGSINLYGRTGDGNSDNSGRGEADQMPIYGNADLEVEANNPFGDADGDDNDGEMYGTVDERVQVAAEIEALAGSTSGPTPADLVASANPFGDDDDANESDGGTEIDNGDRYNIVEPDEPNNFAVLATTEAKAAELPIYGNVAVVAAVVTTAVSDSTDAGNVSVNSTDLAAANPFDDSDDDNADGKDGVEAVIENEESTTAASNPFNSDDDDEAEAAAAGSADDFDPFKELDAAVDAAAAEAVNTSTPPQLLTDNDAATGLLGTADEFIKKVLIPEEQKRHSITLEGDATAAAGGGVRTTAVAKRCAPVVTANNATAVEDASDVSAADAMAAILARRPVQVVAGAATTTPETKITIDGNNPFASDDDDVEDDVDDVNGTLATFAAAASVAAHAASTSPVVHQTEARHAAPPSHASLAPLAASTASPPAVASDTKQKKKKAPPPKPLKKQSSPAPRAASAPTNTHTHSRFVILKSRAPATSDTMQSPSPLLSSMKKPSKWEMAVANRDNQTAPTVIKGDAPTMSVPSGPPCGAYIVDLVSTVFGTCKCGHAKSGHADTALGGGRPRSASLAAPGQGIRRTGSLRPSPQTSPTPSTPAMASPGRAFKLRPVSMIDSQMSGWADGRNIISEIGAATADVPEVTATSVSAVSESVLNSDDSDSDDEGPTMLASDVVTAVSSTTAVPDVVDHPATQPQTDDVVATVVVCLPIVAEAAPPASLPVKLKSATKKGKPKSKSKSKSKPKANMPQHGSSEDQTPAPVTAPVTAGDDTDAVSAPVSVVGKVSSAATAWGSSKQEEEAPTHAVVDEELLPRPAAAEEGAVVVLRRNKAKSNKKGTAPPVKRRPQSLLDPGTLPTFADMWTPAHVCMWLIETTLPLDVAKVKSESITGRVLLSLDADDLRELEVYSKLQQKKVLAAISELETSHAYAATLGVRLATVAPAAATTKPADPEDEELAAMEQSIAEFDARAHKLEARESALAKLEARDVALKERERTIAQRYGNLQKQAKIEGTIEHRASYIDNREETAVDDAISKDTAAVAIAEFAAAMAQAERELVAEAAKEASSAAEAQAAADEDAAIDAAAYMTAVSPTDSKRAFEDTLSPLPETTEPSFAVMKAAASLDAKIERDGKESGLKEKIAAHRARREAETKEVSATHQGDALQLTTDEQPIVAAVPEQPATIESVSVPSGKTARQEIVRRRAAILYYKRVTAASVLQRAVRSWLARRQFTTALEMLRNGLGEAQEYLFQKAYNNMLSGSTAWQFKGVVKHIDAMAETFVSRAVLSGVVTSVFAAMDAQIKDASATIDASYEVVAALEQAQEDGAAKHAVDIELGAERAARENVEQKLAAEEVALAQTREAVQTAARKMETLVESLAAETAARESVEQAVAVGNVAGEQTKRSLASAVSAQTAAENALASETAKREASDQLLAAATAEIDQLRRAVTEAAAARSLAEGAVDTALGTLSEMEQQYAEERTAKQDSQAAHAVTKEDAVKFASESDVAMAAAQKQLAAEQAKTARVELALSEARAASETTKIELSATLSDRNQLRTDLDIAEDLLAKEEAKKEQQEKIKSAAAVLHAALGYDEV
jgi:hypothetical protein